MRRFGVGLALLVAACASSDAVKTGAGTLTLVLAGSTGSEGALVVVVSGGPVSSVGGPAGYQVATNVDGAGTHVMVLGNVVNGGIATLNVPDVSQASAYVATVVQVADRASFGLIDPSRYQVSITK
jgi:hypothetical protein